MKFGKINDDTECDCLANAVQDIENVYARKINKPNVLDADLRSHWEKGTRSDDGCLRVCGLKGLSINIWNEESQDSTIAKFLTTFKITPKSKNSIFLFKFKENAGVVIYTPAKDDKFHYDFYKCDDFIISMIEGLEIKELKEFL